MDWTFFSYGLTLVFLGWVGGMSVGIIFSLFRRL